MPFNLVTEINIGDMTTLDRLIVLKRSINIEFSQNTLWKMGVTILKMHCIYCIDKPYLGLTMEIFYYFQEGTSNKKNLFK